jgi:hypothetical protein
MDEPVSAKASASKVVAVAPRTHDYNLIVRHPFDNYAKGAHIKDADEIDAILAGINVNSVHKIIAQK